MGASHQGRARAAQIQAWVAALCDSLARHNVCPTKREQARICQMLQRELRWAYPNQFQARLEVIVCEIEEDVVLRARAIGPSTHCDGDDDIINNSSSDGESRQLQRLAALRARLRIIQKKKKKDSDPRMPS